MKTVAPRPRGRSRDEDFLAKLAAGYAPAEAEQYSKPDGVCRRWKCEEASISGSRFCRWHGSGGRKGPSGAGPGGHSFRSVCVADACKLFAREGKITCAEHWFKEKVK